MIIEFVSIRRGQHDLHFTLRAPIDNDSNALSIQIDDIRRQRLPIFTDWICFVQEMTVCDGRRIFEQKIHILHVDILTGRHCSYYRKIMSMFWVSGT